MRPCPFTCRQDIGQRFPSASNPVPEQLSRSRAGIVRRSRCCSHISSAFCGSADCACAARAVHSSNSRWQPSRRTCVDLQSWLLDRRRLCRPGALRERSVQFVASRLRGKRWSQCVRAAAPRGLAETTASPRPQSIVGTANTSFTPDFCNKIGHKRSSRLLHILLVSNSSARPDSKNVLSA
jgi:hypothetical protein